MVNGGVVVGVCVYLWESEYGNMGMPTKTGWVQHSSRANANNSPLLWEMRAGLNPLWLFTDIYGLNSWKKAAMVNMHA